MITARQRAALLRAEHSHDHDLIHTAVIAVLAASPGTSLLEVEMVLREAGTQTYLIHTGGSDFELASSLPEMLAKVGTPTANRMALAQVRITKEPE